MGTGMDDKDKDKDDLRAALLEIAALRGNIIRSMNWSGESYEAGCIIAFARCADIADAALEKTNRK